MCTVQNVLLQQETSSHSQRMGVHFLLCLLQSWTTSPPLAGSSVLSMASWRSPPPQLCIAHVEYPAEDLQTVDRVKESNFLIYFYCVMYKGLGHEQWSSCNFPLKTYTDLKKQLFFSYKIEILLVYKWMCLITCIFPLMIFNTASLWENGKD